MPKFFNSEDSLCGCSHMTLTFYQKRCQSDCPLPAVHSSASTAFAPTLGAVTMSCKARQNPATSLFDSDRFRRKQTVMGCSQFIRWKKKKKKNPAQVLIIWYWSTDFARLPVTYNTYTLIQYTAHTWCMLFSSYCVNVLLACSVELCMAFCQLNVRQSSLV